MTAVPPLRYALRPIAPHERELAYTLTREAMRSYVEQTWGAWIEVEQRERHALSFNPSEQDFILQGGEVLGLRALRWRPTDLFLARLYLRPQAQGKGLGSAVLGDLLGQARAAGRSVELQVLKVNGRAQRFYARHGFERVGEREAYWLMRAC
jgi:ribosomal protein S18 acetylase RimI-like enzyme